MNYSKLPNQTGKRSFSKFKKWSKEEDSQEDDLSEESGQDDLEFEENLIDLRNLLKELLTECRNLSSLLLRTTAAQ